MLAGGTVLAYHGCDRRIGEQILSGRKDVQLSKNDYDWLGTGAYFWENSYARALQWATFLRDNPGISKGRIRKPFVLGAVISPGNCLDLSEAASLNILGQGLRLYHEVMFLAGVEVPVNESGFFGDADLVKRKLDCALINFFHDSWDETEEPYDTVRCPFIEGKPIYPGSKIASRTHIQWCVRNPARTVLGYFRPRRKAPL